MAIGFVVGRPHILVVEPNDGLSHSEILADIFFGLCLKSIGFIVVERQSGFGCRLKDAFQRLHGEDSTPFLDDGHEKKDHQQGKQDTIISNPRFSH
jgi:hypothetical protein